MALAPQTYQPPGVNLNQSIGQKAKNPQSGIVQPKTTLPSSQAAPVTPPATPPQNNGLVGSPSSLNAPGSTPYNANNPYPYYVGQMGNYGNTQNDPTYQRLIKEQGTIQSNAPVALTSLENDSPQNWGTPQSVVNSREAQTSNLYSNLLSAKQAEINNYLTSKGQAIGATGSAMSATAPQNQLGFLTAPITGQPIYGNGTIGGLAGLSYEAGKINNAGALAGQQQNQGIAINSARNAKTQLDNLLKTSNLNQNQLALSNWLGNVAAQNLSNPTLAPIQNAVTSAINQYAKAQGIDPAALTNSLLLQSGSQSIMSVLNNLDTGAYNNYTNTGNVATGGGVSAPTTNLGTAKNTTSGATTGGNKYVITP